MTPVDPVALFERQRAYALAMARTTAAERGARLARLRDVILARRSDVGAALQADFGKPPIETELSETHVVLAEIAHARRNVRRWMRPRRAGNPLLFAFARSRIRWEPKGVVLVISPWNYPFGLALTPVVAAVAAGNCVVLKPSERAPATSALLAEVVAQAFPPEEVAVAEGGADVTQALLSLPFDHILFTGGQHTARLVAQAAAEHLTPVTLELGGKSPAIVDQTADVALAAESIAWSKGLNAGQTCLAADYALVHESRLTEFLEAIKAAFERFYGPEGEARRRSDDLARVVDDTHFTRLVDAVRRTVADGATIVTGGEWDAPTRYLAPTVLADVRPDMAVMDEELFGPVLPVLAVRSLEEATELVRARERPLAVYVFTSDRARAERVIAATSTGAAVVNGTMLHYANYYLPFGGVGASGQGSYHGEHGFRTFSHARAEMVLRPARLYRALHPPYRGWLKRLVWRMIRLLE